MRSEVCLSCCLLVLVTQFDYVWWRLPPSFPLVDDSTRWCGDRRFLYPDIVPDIAQKEGSGGPPPVASQSHCVCSQYLTSYVSLRWFLMLHSGALYLANVWFASICSPGIVVRNRSFRCPQLVPANAFKTLFLLLTLLVTCMKWLLNE